jgi:two-component system sensor histidine kinase/response regulator
MTNQAQATVLVVDDDPAILANVTDLLRIEGYHCLSASNGIMALGVMQQHTPDLILADIMMPQMNGYMFFQAVRDNPAWTLIPFIFMSAKGEQKDIRWGYQLGADHYLTKPFEPEDLSIAVKSRLQRAAEMQAAAQDGVEQIRHSFLNVVGHELRTPLTYIYGYLSLFEAEGEDVSKEAIGEFLSGMRKGTDRLIKLVEDLMLVVTIDSGAAKREISQFSERVDLGVEIQGAIQSLSAQAEANQVTVNNEVLLNMIVHGIPTYIQGIFKRLIDNAIKFSHPTDGQVWVNSEIRDGQALISVRDEGIGIAPEMQAAIFERFHQIDRHRMEQQGMGLGLAIAFDLVQLHGGDLRVESQPGEGTTMSVFLPLENKG